MGESDTRKPGVFSRLFGRREQAAGNEAADTQKPSVFLGVEVPAGNDTEAEQIMANARTTAKSGQQLNFTEATEWRERLFQAAYDTQLAEQAFGRTEPAASSEGDQPGAGTIDASSDELPAELTALQELPVPDSGSDQPHAADEPRWLDDEPAEASAGNQSNEGASTASPAAEQVAASNPLVAADEAIDRVYARREAHVAKAKSIHSFLQVIETGLSSPDPTQDPSLVSLFGQLSGQPQQPSPIRKSDVDRLVTDVAAALEGVRKVHQEIEAINRNRSAVKTGYDSLNHGFGELSRTVSENVGSVSDATRTAVREQGDSTRKAVFAANDRLVEKISQLLAASRADLLSRMETLDQGQQKLASVLLELVGRTQPADMLSASLSASLEPLLRQFLEQVVQNTSPAASPVAAETTVTEPAETFGDKPHVANLSVDDMDIDDLPDFLQNDPIVPEQLPVRSAKDGVDPEAVGAENFSRKDGPGKSDKPAEKIEPPARPIAEDKVTAPAVAKPGKSASTRTAARQLTMFGVPYPKGSKTAAERIVGEARKHIKVPGGRDKVDAKLLNQAWKRDLWNAVFAAEGTQSFDNTVVRGLADLDFDEPAPVAEPTPAKPNVASAASGATKKPVSAKSTKPALPVPPADEEVRALVVKHLRKEGAMDTAGVRRWLSEQYNLSRKSATYPTKILEKGPFNKVGNLWIPA